MMPYSERSLLQDSGEGLETTAASLSRDVSK